MREALKKANAMKGLSTAERWRLFTDIGEPHECWPWMGHIEQHGYGRGLYHMGRVVRPHRLAIEIATGCPVPSGMVVDHVCRNRRCVNPLHLRVVTRIVNALENSLSPFAIKARQTHCQRGHELSGDNLGIFAGRRRCMRCVNERRQLKRRLARDAKKTTPDAVGRSV